MSDLPIGELGVVVEPKEELKCGDWYKYVSPVTGDKHSVQHQCKDIHTCDICLNRRVEKYRSRMLAYAMRNELHFATYSDRTWKNLVKRIDGKKGFLHFPQTNGQHVVFMATELEHGEPISTYELEQLDWPTIACTPIGLRMSGSLGKSSKVEDDEEKTTITIQGVTAKKVAPMGNLVSISNAEDDVCFLEAIAETIDLNPQTIEETQVAYTVRTAAYVVALERHGFHTYTHNHRKKIVRNGYVWGNTLRTKFQRLLDMGLVTADDMPKEVFLDT
jgi:hypothetical protein